MVKRKSPGFQLTSALSVCLHISWLVFQLFGRGYGLTNRLLRPFIGSREIEIKIAPDSVFQFNASDTYWNKLLLGNYKYEPEMHALLRKLRNTDVFFLDCGANFGYWSILASSSRYGSQATLAIEAGTEAFSRLKKNAKKNANRFNVLQRAVFNSPGILMRFSTDNHPGARRLDAQAKAFEEIETVSIDSVLSEIGNTRPIVVKLDIEGAEISAISGAMNTLAEEVLWAYEDHGSDQTSMVTRHLIDDHDLAIFIWKDDERFDFAANLDEVNQHKVDRRVGYNFFACKRNGYFASILSKDFE